MIAPTMATKAVESNNLVIASSWQPVDFRGYVSEINAFSNSIATTELKPAITIMYIYHNIYWRWQMLRYLT